MNRTGEWDSVFIGYSRDGFHWSRPIIDGKHRVFLPMSDVVVKEGSTAWPWNKANVQSVGGGFTVQRDSPMRFYVGARTGTDQLIGNASMGMAELRRDGFASVGAANGTASAELMTRPVAFCKTKGILTERVAGSVPSPRRPRLTCICPPHPSIAHP